MAPDARNTILFAGFQSGGTCGAALVSGTDQIKIHGRYVPVRAIVMNIESMSAHADYEEMLQWLSHFKRPLKHVFITPESLAAADAMRKHVEDVWWSCSVPEYRDG